VKNNSKIVSVTFLLFILIIKSGWGYSASSCLSGYIILPDASISSRLSYQVYGDNQYFGYSKVLLFRNLEIGVLKRIKGSGINQFIVSGKVRLIAEVGPLPAITGGQLFINGRDEDKLTFLMFEKNIKLTGTKIGLGLTQDYYKKRKLAFAIEQHLFWNFNLLLERVENNYNGGVRIKFLPGLYLDVSALDIEGNLQKEKVFYTLTFGVRY